MSPEKKRYVIYMAIDTDPDLYDFSVPPDICNACFDVGKTPDILFVCLSGILPGDLWVGGDLPPPNGIWPVHTFGACHWKETVSGYPFSYQPTIGGFTSLLVGIVGLEYFVGGDPAICKIWMANVNVNPVINKYYGGYATLMTALTGGNDVLSNLMDDMVLRRETQNFISPGPMATNRSTMKYFNQSDNSSCKFLLENL